MTKDRSTTAEIRQGLPVVAFASQQAFSEWLSAQPPDAAGAWIKLAKKGGDAARLTKAEAIDAALCHGWIDGQSDKYDDASWLIRFTPRKRRSRWSEVNRKRAEELLEAGKVCPAGLAQIDAAKADGRWDNAYPSASAAIVPPDLHAALDGNPKAAAFFATLKGVNRYAVLYRIGAVKTAETRARKIETFVAMLERGETFYP